MKRVNAMTAPPHPASTCCLLLSLALAVGACDSKSTNDSQPKPDIIEQIASHRARCDRVSPGHQDWDSCFEQSKELAGVHPEIAVAVCGYRTKLLEHGMVRTNEARAQISQGLGTEQNDKMLGALEVLFADEASWCSKCKKLGGAPGENCDNKGADVVRKLRTLNKALD